MSNYAFCISWSDTRVVLRSNKQSKNIFFKYSCLLKYTTHGAFCKKRLICTYSCCNSRGMLTVQTLRYVISLLLLNEPSVKKVTLILVTDTWVHLRCYYLFHYLTLCHIPHHMSTHKLSENDSHVSHVISLQERCFSNNNTKVDKTWTLYLYVTALYKLVSQCLEGYIVVVWKYITHICQHDSYEYSNW